MDAVNKEDNLKTPSYFYIVFLVNNKIHFRDAFKQAEKLKSREMKEG